ncbi:hypothetical protein FOXYSP1_13918 [Fusarium oxysporum f. sp. phaseoli]
MPTAERDRPFFSFCSCRLRGILSSIGNPCH